MERFAKTVMENKSITLQILWFFIDFRGMGGGYRV